jgi:hypothetical protein
VNLRNVDCSDPSDVRFTIVWSDGYSASVHGYDQPEIYDLTWPYAGENEWTVAPEDRVLCPDGM